MMVSWFKYFTEPSSLDEDLKNSNKLKDGDKLKIMREFLYEADQCDKKMEMSRKQPPDMNNIATISPGQASPVTVFTDMANNFSLDNGRDNYIQQMRKSHVLYILALKVFANLRYNINLIHNWGVPLCLMGNLQRTFLKVTTGVPNLNPVQDVDWPGWTGISRFAQIIFHFWTLLEGLDRVLIKSHKRCLTPPLPGLTEVPDIVFVNESSIEESAIVARLEQSAQILTMLLERGDATFDVPVSHSFKVPELDSDSTMMDEVIEGVSASPQSIRSNIMFFLGRHCFQRKEFKKALEYFTVSKETMDTAYDHLYFTGLTDSLLVSYISLCTRLIGQPPDVSTSFQEIEEQISRRQWDADRLTYVLMKELFRRFECSVMYVLNSTAKSKAVSPINLPLREQLEKEMKMSLDNEGDKTAFFKVSVCNLLERVISGHAILTTFISDISGLTDLAKVKDILKYLNHQTISCLDFFQEMRVANNSKPLGEMKRSLSCPDIFSEEIPIKYDFNLEIQNIKCFINFLAQTLPQEMEFPYIIYHSDLMKHFTSEEVEEIKAIMNDIVLNLDDLDIYDLENAECDWFSVHDKKHPTADNESENSFNIGTSNINEIDTLRMLSSYDCEEIKDILLRLYANNATNKHSIVSLCIHWTVSPALMDELKNIKKEFEFIYTYVLLAKATVLRDLSSWDLAKFVYDTVKSSTNNHKLKRLVNNEITCNDLQKFLYTYQDLNPKKFADENHFELVNSAKLCLTSARIDNNLWVTETLITSCCCFLLTVNEYDYLLSIPNTVSTTVELSSLLITVSRDFEKLKYVKSSKDLFDFLLKVVVPTKKSGVYNCMNQQQLRLFIELLGNCNLLDLLICALVSILTCLRSDINLSRPLFPKDIWPTTISSNFNTAIDTTHLDSMVLFGIDKAINQNPHNFNWLFIKADLAIAEADYFKAMKHYLEAGAAATEFYTKPITKEIFNDWVLQQMIRSCREMGYYHQAIFLCQYIPEINIAAQLANQVTVSNDSSDLYIHLMWDLNLMEILAAIEYDRGAFSKHKKFIDALSQPDMSSNNSPDIILSCQERKKLEFLRVISMQYVMR